MSLNPPPAPSSPSPAGADPAPAADARLDPFRLGPSSRRRYRPRHDAAVVLAEIRRLRGAAGGRTSGMSSQTT
jgi:hypothetical protein